MNTTWKIIDLKRKVPSGFVTEVTYLLEFELEGCEDRHFGTLNFAGDQSTPNFIPFGSLSEETVINWVKEKLGQDKVNQILTDFERRLQAAIQARKNPPFANGLPWQMEPGTFIP